MATCHEPNLRQPLPEQRPFGIRVRLRRGDPFHKLLGEDWTAPYEASWAGAPIGSDVLGARAIYDGGAVDSATVTVDVLDPSADSDGDTVAYTPPYATHSYFPSVGEISVTVGFVCLLILAYRFVVLNFPVLASQEGAPPPRTKYSLRRAAL